MGITSLSGVQVCKSACILFYSMHIQYYAYLLKILVIRLQQVGVTNYIFRCKLIKFVYLMFQFIQRILIMFMPVKTQPDYIYLRHVPTKRVYIFTAIQLLGMTIMWLFKSFKKVSILFPPMVIINTLYFVEMYNQAQSRFSFYYSIRMISSFRFWPYVLFVKAWTTISLKQNCIGSITFYRNRIEGRRKMDTWTKLKMRMGPKIRVRLNYKEYILYKYWYYQLRVRLTYCVCLLYQMRRIFIFVCYRKLR